VHLRGEAWSAAARAGTISAGSRVRVVARQGLTLLVEPLEG
jgi:membrane protein implicated in regulation of membrane protease activity